MTVTEALDLMTGTEALDLMRVTEALDLMRRPPLLRAGGIAVALVQQVWSAALVHGPCAEETATDYTGPCMGILCNEELCRGRELRCLA